MLGTVADAFGVTAKLSRRPTSPIRIMMSNDDSLTVYEYAHTRPLMIRLYCIGDRQYFITKTADAEFVKAAVGKSQLNDRKYALCWPALTVACDSDLNPA